ncbi:MAG: hypothetical protein WC381_05110 [Kiritimatiellia bacterium]|jgi:hypothetical protein
MSASPVKLELVSNGGGYATFAGGSTTMFVTNSVDIEIVGRQCGVWMDDMALVATMSDGRKISTHPFTVGQIHVDVNDGHSVGSLDMIINGPDSPAAAVVSKGQNVTMTVTTEPADLANEVVWNTSGNGDPVTGQGASFTTQWHSGWEWVEAWVNGRLIGYWRYVCADVASVTAYDLYGGMPCLGLTYWATTDPPGFESYVSLSLDPTWYLEGVHTVTGTIGDSSATGTFHCVYTYVWEIDGPRPVCVECDPETFTLHRRLYEAGKCVEDAIWPVDKWRSHGVPSSATNTNTYCTSYETPLGGTDEVSADFPCYGRQTMTNKFVLTYDNMTSFRCDNGYVNTNIPGKVFTFYPHPILMTATKICSVCAWGDVDEDFLVGGAPWGVKKESVQGNTMHVSKCAAPGAYDVVATEGVTSLPLHIENLYIAFENVYRAYQWAPGTPHVTDWLSPESYDCGRLVWSISGAVGDTNAAIDPHTGAFTCGSFGGGGYTIRAASRDVPGYYGETAAYVCCLRFADASVIRRWDDRTYNPSPNWAPGSYLNGPGHVTWSLETVSGDTSASINAYSGRVTFGAGGGQYVIHATSKDVPGYEANMALTVVKVEIKAEDGSAPDESICVGAAKNFKAVVTPAIAGTYIWSTTSDKITLAGTLSETVTVNAGAFASSAAYAEDLYVEFKPAGLLDACDDAHSLTVVKVGCEAIDSVRKGATKSVVVTVAPVGSIVTLKLATTTGTGSATFDDGTTEKVIADTTTVTIKGVTESSVTDNIKLFAEIDGVECFSEEFSVVQVGFEAIDSVCKGGTKDVLVTVTPSGSIKLKLATTTGTGSATFDDGTTEKVIADTTTVTIKGVTESSVTDNIKLFAEIDGVECFAEKFSVVKVESIQFRIGGSTAWRDFTGAQKILYGKDAYLLATNIQPSGVTLPAGMPSWTGTFGASGSGLEVLHTYSGAPSGYDSDTKTVSTTCGPDTPKEFLVCTEVLGIHANVDPGAGFTDGHAWISVTDYSSGSPFTVTYGLWGNRPRTTTNSDVHVGLENTSGIHNRYYLLSPSGYDALVSFVSAPSEWTYTHTCANWAEDAYHTATGETVDSSDYVIFGTPRAIAGSIVTLETAHPTTCDMPLEGGEDASSTSEGSSWGGSSFP